ncbi:MAG: ABC transporter substrate-binding protein [Desulfovibrionaceae bacterium]
MATVAATAAVMALALALAGCGGGEEKAAPSGQAAQQADQSADQQAAETPAAEPVRIGGMIDLSGPTSEVGNPYAQGLSAATAYINDNGGINGRPLEFLLEDTSYKAERGQDIYNRFVYQEKVVALQGFGTAVSQDLKGQVAQDRIPNFTASYSADLTDPAQAPYNFFIATDYSTQIRCALQWFKDQWKEERAPRVAFIYPDHPYGKTPIPAGKEYAAELGYEIVAEENVSLSAKEADANPAIIRLKDLAPDFTWIGGTTKSTAAICKAAKANSFETAFFTNIWGCDEDLVRLAGEAAEGVYSNQAAAAWGADVPGMRVIETLAGGEHQMTHYVRGFASMLVMAEGLKRADAAGELTGESLKAALEKMTDFDPMGLTPAISFTPEDHRPNMGIFLYQVRGGKLAFVEAVNLERRAEWLGK